MSIKLTRDNLEELLNEIYVKYPTLKINGSVESSERDYPRVLIEVKNTYPTHNKYFDYKKSFVLIFNLPAFTKEEINNIRTRVTIFLNAALTFMED